MNELEFCDIITRIAYKKVLNIINTDLYKYNARIFTEYAYKPPYGLVPK